MKCPQCEAWTEVRETRGTKRRRECGNGHRFTTEEVVLYTDTSKARDKEERRRQVAMEPGTQIAVAAKYGVSPRSVALWRKQYKQEK